MKLASALIIPAITLFAASLCSCGLVAPLVRTAAPLAGLKLTFSCLPEHTLVDTPSGPRAVEKLEAGEAVIGFDGQPVRILQKHAYMESPQTVFLRITFDDGASVDLCGMHRVNGTRARDIRTGDRIAGRTVTGIATRTGETRSYDLLTGDAGYQIHGVPVNSMIEEMLSAASGGMSPVRD